MCTILGSTDFSHLLSEDQITDYAGGSQFYDYINWQIDFFFFSFLEHLPHAESLIKLFDKFNLPQVFMEIFSHNKQVEKF